jgi:uncharacterized protein YpuA (DUF1002 family)
MSVSNDDINEKLIGPVMDAMMNAVVMNIKKGVKLEKKRKKNIEAIVKNALATVQIKAPDNNVSKYVQTKIGSSFDNQSILLIWNKIQQQGTKYDKSKLTGMVEQLKQRMEFGRRIMLRMIKDKYDVGAKSKKYYLIK